MLTATSFARSVIGISPKILHSKYRNKLTCFLGHDQFSVVSQSRLPMKQQFYKAARHLLQCVHQA